MVERTIEINDEVIELKFRNTDVQKIDEKLGYSAMHLLEKAYDKGVMAAFSMNDIATVIWGGMLHRSPGLRLEQVVNMLPMHIKEFAPIATDVFNIVMEIYGVDGEAEVVPEDQEDQEVGNLPPGPEAGTGEKPSE